MITFCQGAPWNYDSIPPFVSVSKKVILRKSVHQSKHPTRKQKSQRESMKWCAASSLDNIKSMEQEATIHNIDTICKDSPNSAIRLLRKPFFNKFVVLFLICTLIGMSTATVIEPRASKLAVTPQAQTCQKHVERVGDGNPHPSCR